MDAVSISAEARESFGKGTARKLRAAGKIPAVIYRGGNTPNHIAIDPAELARVFRKSNNRNTLLSVAADGNEHICLVKEVQRDPGSQEIIHLDLFEVDANEEVRVEVNLVPSGTPVGVKMGGRLRVIRRTVDVVCKPGDIPAVIDANVTNLETGKFFRLSDVPAPAGTAFPYPNDFNLFTVIGKRVAQ